MSKPMKEKGLHLRTMQNISVLVKTQFIDGYPISVYSQQRLAIAEDLNSVNLIGRSGVEKIVIQIMEE